MSSPSAIIISKILSTFRQQSRPLKPLYSTLGKPSETKNENESKYHITRATKEDYDGIIKLMHESYYEEEPTCSCLGVTPNPVLDERRLRAMAEGYSLVAKCAHDGSIAGGAINESTHPWDPDLGEKLACSVKCPKVKQLILFYAYVMRAPDLWECLGVGKIFEMANVFVKRAHRRNGLAHRLMKRSKALGADCGFGVLRCDATSEHTAGICENLGMQLVAEIPYCTYLGPDLLPVFKPPFPHQSVKVYCDCSPQLNELRSKLDQKIRQFRNGIGGSANK
ncbi:uncharacterized protein LOC132702296 [Cylas formicarius]|uniref:uncharacterized protein LOC132702296 n=1 Tax=Cylas formicarius TaxID=197179 RepID=UPI0029586E17|nr:uncharacterized protein LOC132702296 [Cylas formicarius]